MLDCLRTAYNSLHLNFQTFKFQMAWTRGPELGKGSTAAVSLAAFPDEEFLAVKSIEISNSKSRFLQREMEILSTLSYPNVVAYKGFDVSKECYNLFMEYVPGGTLSDEIRRQGGMLDDWTIRSYTCQILSGLKYLHSNGVIHCDIKCSNILVNEAEHVVKLADFGCSKRIVETDSDRVSNGSVLISGTPVCMAPESARGEEQGMEGDIWAVGCTVIEMATGRLAWQDSCGSDPARILYRIAYSDRVPALPSSLSEQGKDFLTKCLVRDPKQRWTATELLNHPFVTNVESLEKPTQSVSPTSILDYQIWNADKDEAMSQCEAEVEVESSGDLEDERMEQLVGVSGRPSWMWDDEDWIPVRLESKWSISHQISDECFCFSELDDGSSSDFGTSRFGYSLVSRLVVT